MCFDGPELSLLVCPARTCSNGHYISTTRGTASQNIILINPISGEEVYWNNKASSTFLKLDLRSLMCLILNAQFNEQMINVAENKQTMKTA
jgi:hypothetical protein